MTDFYASGIEDMVRRRVKRVALAGGAADAFAFAWQNPEDKKIIVTRVVVDITTAGGTATADLDVGVAANATTGATDIFDAIDANAAAVSDHLLVSGAGAGGAHKVDEKDGTNDYITGQITTEAAASLAGYVYIEYFIVED